MRCRIPTSRDIRRTLLGILQSTAFLTTSAFSYCLFLCIIRKYVGSFNFYTASYVPAFMSSVCALLIERPSRRGLLCLYVSNVATETIFRMAAVRGIVQPIKYGQVLIFAVSTSILLYLYHCGLNRNNKDSIFEILRFVVGSSEEPVFKVGDNTTNREAVQFRTRSFKQINQRSSLTISNVQNSGAHIEDTSRRASRFKIKFYTIILRAVHIYKNIIISIKRMQRHRTCLHSSSCIYYAMQNGTKLFTIGLGIQILLKIVLQLKRIMKKGPSHLLKVLFTRDTLQLGIFLGGFSSLYRVIFYFCYMFKQQTTKFFFFFAGMFMHFTTHHK